MIKNRHQLRLRENFNIQFIEHYFPDSKKGVSYIYGAIRIARRTNGKQVTHTLQFSRKSWNKQYAGACEKQAKMQGWPHSPKSWLKAKPNFDDLLKRCHVVEDPANKGRFMLVDI